MIHQTEEEERKRERARTQDGENKKSRRHIWVCVHAFIIVFSLSLFCLFFFYVQFFNA